MKIRAGQRESTSEVGDTNTNAIVFTANGNELNVPDKTVSLSYKKKKKLAVYIEHKSESKT